MKHHIIRILPLALLFIGAGCMPVVAPESPEAQVPVVPAPVADAYEGWGTVTPGGVVTLRIPPGCTTDSGAGSTYIVCPTPGNDTPTPDMRISSDGQLVHIQRWENQKWEQWDKVIASLKVLAPLDREVTIQIQK
jgi:hypothetical protein